MGMRKTPGGLKVRVQCHALMREYTDVLKKFDETKGRTEDELQGHLYHHYTKVEDHLRTELTRINHLMGVEGERATESERNEHERCMRITMETAKKLTDQLRDKKRKKLERLGEEEEDEDNPPPPKRKSKGTGQGQGNNRGRGGRRKRPRGRGGRNSPHPRDTTSDPTPKLYSRSEVLDLFGKFLDGTDVPQHHGGGLPSACRRGGVTSGRGAHTRSSRGRAGSQNFRQGGK